MAKVTAILLNYQRPMNMPVIIGTLRDQTESPEIMIINNHDLLRPVRGVEKQVFIPWNAGCYVRLTFTPWVTTEWVMFLDDDLVPSDDEFVRDALEIAARHPVTTIIGAYGRRLGRTAPYYHGQPDVTGFTPIVKGRFMLFRRIAMQFVQMVRYPLHLNPQYLLQDDLYLSLELGRGHAIHWADEGLQKRLRDLPGADGGLAGEPDHYRIREQFCAEYVNQIM